MIQPSSASSPTPVGSPHSTVNSSDQLNDDKSEDAAQNDTAHGAIEHYAVRVGVHGQVGRFAAPSEKFTRGSAVICRTQRGLEVGSVLTAIRFASQSNVEEPAVAASQAMGRSHDDAATDGHIVRRMTAEDQLLWGHLQGLASDAAESCQKWLEANNSVNQLIDVEPLLDGKTLYFHFLNQPNEETDAQIDKLVEIFQQTVETSEFRKLLEHGCGPGCGTDKATRGCGTACASCTTKCAVR